LLDSRREIMSEYANRVAQICYDFYKKTVPPKCKPANTEWTTLASILLETRISSNDETSLKVLCMTTGTKCLSEKQLPVDGTLVHDSHAEILARRCFIRYMINEIGRLQAEPSFKSEILVFAESAISDKPSFSVRPDVKFVLFISHTPCK